MQKSYTYSISSMFIIGAVLFWGVPVLSGFIDEQQTISLTRTFIEVVQPSFCALSGFFYTRSAKFTWYLPIGMMLLFLPVCFIYYPIDMIVWVPVYGVLSLGGCLVAEIIKKRQMTKS